MPNPNAWRPPYLGAAYYPEDWPPEQIDQDIDLMKQAGCNVMRIGEFAWSSMEPQEGQYEFAWLHTVVDRLADAGIATVMGTPTCTPPAWLTERYPEVLFVNADGVRITHGGRRHTCPNSPVYREHCARIVTRMGEEFGRHPGVIGWQIDNEVSPHGAHSCCCPVCVRKFQDWMRGRFGTIEELNKAWCTSLWSQTYQSFSQLPTPMSSVWHHPSLLLAWDEFNSRSYVEFVGHQADILRGLTDAPIGTDMMPYTGISYYDMHRKLDLVQHNHYHYGDDLWQSCFWFDYCRPVKSAPFWNTETATGWSGSNASGGYSEPGFCRANSWMPVAMGGEANLYWLWRQHWAGQELMHGAVVSSQGRPLHMFDEVREISDGFRASADFLNGARPEPGGLALHFSLDAARMFGAQPTVYAFQYQVSLMQQVYRPLVRSQFRPDVIDPESDLAPYRLILTPFLPALDEGGLRERIHDWIEAGGIWIVGPFSDIRDMDGAKFRHSPYGSLEEWGGVYCRYQVPGYPREFELQWSDGPTFKGSLWYDGLEVRGAEPLVTYTDGPNAGLAAVTRQRIGKGQLIVLGTLPGEDDLMRLVNSVAPDAGVAPVAEASANLMVVPRAGASGRGLVAVEFENRPATLVLPREATDLLTGRKQSGTVEVGPYGVVVLKYTT